MFEQGRVIRNDDGQILGWIARLVQGFGMLELFPTGQRVTVFTPGQLIEFAQTEYDAQGNIAATTRISADPALTSPPNEPTTTEPHKSPLLLSSLKTETAHLYQT